MEVAVKLFFFFVFVGLAFWYFSSERGTNTILQNKITTMQTQIDNLEARANNAALLVSNLNNRIDEWNANQKKLTLQNEDKYLKLNEFCHEMNIELGKFVQKSVTDNALRTEKLHGIMQADVDLLKGKCDHLLRDMKKHRHNINWLKNNKEPQLVEVSFVEKPKVSASRPEIKKIKKQMDELSQ